MGEVEGPEVEFRKCGGMDSFVLSFRRGVSVLWDV